MRRVTIALCAGVMLALAGGAQAAIHNVEIHDNFFSPATLQVAVGDTVRWTHMGEHPHTATQSTGIESCDFQDGGFDSGMLTNGDTFDWVPGSVGDVYYFCQFHCPPMYAEIEVEESTPVDAALWSTVKALYR